MESTEIIQKNPLTRVNDFRVFIFKKAEKKYKRGIGWETYPLHLSQIIFLVTANFDVFPLYKSSKLTAIWCMISTCRQGYVIENDAKWKMEEKKKKKKR